MNSAVKTLKTENTPTPIQPMSSSHLVLSPEQLEHFTDGDGLFLQCPEGNVIGFIHESNLESVPDGSQELRDEARDQLHLMEMLVMNQDEYLELSPQAVQGLATTLSNIKDKI